MISIGYGFFISGRTKEGEIRRIILEWKTIFLSLECRMPYNFIVRVLTITRGKNISEIKVSWLHRCIIEERI